METRLVVSGKHRWPNLIRRGYQQTVQSAPVAAKFTRNSVHRCVLGRYRPNEKQRPYLLPTDYRSACAMRQFFVIFDLLNIKNAKYTP